MAPDRAKVEERANNAHVGDGTFKLNLFVVDEYSAKNAAAQKTSLQGERGFVSFTRADAGNPAFRFEYTLDGGKAGVSLRLDLGGGRVIDCGVHGVAPEIAAQVATACSTVKAL
jgi:hypothetical protein